MKYLMYIFLGFWAVWCLWYLSGGPLRSEKSKPFIVPNGSGFDYVDKVDTGLDTYINR